MSRKPDKSKSKRKRGTRRPPRSLEGRRPHHQLWPEIYERLVNHWGPATIERDLRRRYAEQIEDGTLDVPSTRTIERWREQYLTEKDLLPPRLIEEALKALPLLVDVYREAALLVPLLQNRVVQAQRVEEQIGGIPIAGLDKAAETFLKYVDELWHIGQSLGIYPASPLSLGALAIGELKMGGAGRQDYSDDEWQAYLEAEYRFKTGREPPRFDDGGSGEALEGPGPAPTLDEA